MARRQHQRAGAGRIGAEPGFLDPACQFHVRVAGFELGPHRPVADHDQRHIGAGGGGGQRADPLVGFAPADNPTIAVAAVVVNTPLWRIKASYVAREALRYYLVENPATRVTPG